MHPPFFSQPTSGLTYPYVLVTPTPAQQGITLEVGPPSGWVAAGLLILLFAIMLYQTLVKTIRRLFRRKK